jgi:hypothetical protein
MSARGRWLAAGLLGGHVVRRAHGGVDLRDRQHDLLLGVDRLGDAEVHDLHVGLALALPREEDVLGLDVPVHDALAVRHDEGLEHLAHDRDRLARQQLVVPHEVRREVDAREQLEHDEQRAVVGVFARVEHLHHVGVLHLPRGVGLVHEALDVLPADLALGVHDLDGHVPVRPVTRCSAS